MASGKKPKLKTRVEQAAREVLAQQGSVSFIDVLLHIGWLPYGNLERWKDGRLEILQERIACKSDRHQEAFEIFRRWTARQNLQAIEGKNEIATRNGPRRLQATFANDPELEAFFATTFLPQNASKRKVTATRKKASKAPEIIVYIRSSRSETECGECGVEIQRRQLFRTEDDIPLCLNCADLGHLEFLPSGNATLTRRAGKYSPLKAIAVEFNKRRKRYERRGTLVTAEAIQQAEEECEADADVRERMRERRALAAKRDDVELAEAMRVEILKLFPSCPKDEAEAIAQHTAVRGSGRVGRSAAGRQLSPEALKLAVIAHIRHTHTDYDRLLMNGTPRQTARDWIADSLSKVLEHWQDRS